MLIAAGPLPEVLKFIQILCWIIIPILTTAVLTTIYFHRKKKKKVDGIDPFETSTAEKVAYTNGNGELIFFDHSKLIRNYKKRLSTANARYKAVENDLSILQEKYSATARYSRILFLTKNNVTMENLNGQMPLQLEQEINRIAEETVAEKKELCLRIEKLEHTIERMERKNVELKERIKLHGGGEDEKLNALAASKEEVANLREKLCSMEYLEDVIEEKNVQINFLQQQIEQKVRNFHQSEQQRSHAAAESERVKIENEELSEKITSLNTELQSLRNLDGQIGGLMAELEEKKQLLNAGQGEVSYLQTLLIESGQQNEFMDAELSDCRNRESNLIKQLEQEQSRSLSLEHQLQNSKQLIRKVYRELSLAAQEEHVDASVIPLHSVANEVVS